MARPHPLFSIVIPTLNEENYLPKLLEDLADQHFTDFEVIHIDGNSEDKTVSVSKKFSSKMNVCIQTIADRNVSKQRNLGAKISRGKWIIFMDADNRLSKNFLSELAKKLEASRCDIFTCYMENLDIPIPDRPIMTLSNIWLKVSAKIKPVAPGALIGLRNHLAQRIEFDETLHMSEDFEFVQKAVKEHLRFVVFEEPKYVYSLRRLKKEGSLKMFRVYAQAQINFFLTDQKITKPLKSYPMNGGSYYNSIPKFSLSKIQQLIETSSKTQLEKMKLLIKSFSEF